MTYAEIAERLAAGDRVARTSWDGQWVEMQPMGPLMTMRLPFLITADPSAPRIPYQATAEDEAARDWHIVR